MNTSYIPPKYCQISDLLISFGRAFFDGYPNDIGDLEVNIGRESKYFSGYTFIKFITFDAIKAISDPLIKELDIIKNIAMTELNGEKKAVYFNAVYSRNSDTYTREPQYPEIFSRFNSLFEKTSINFRSKTFIKNLTNLLKRDEIRKKIRDALSSGKINAYCLNKNFEKIPSTIWIEEKHWFSLILDNAIYLSSPAFYSGDNQKETRKICFNKSEVDNFLLEHNKLDAFKDAHLIELLLRGVKEGKIILRGTERLLCKAKILFSEEEFKEKYIKNSANKGYLYNEIKKIAANSKLEVIDKARLKYPELKKGNITPEQFNQGYVTKKEIEDIAKIIRPIYEQK